MSRSTPEHIVPPSIPDATASPATSIVRKATEIRVFFDLDFTLIISDRSDKWKFLAEFQHLTKVDNVDIGATYFIFLEQTKQLFHWLLANNVKIGFATHSARKKEDVFSLLEKHYELPSNALVDAIYIDGTELAVGVFSKCERLDDMADILGIKQDVVFLVDDNKRQFRSEDDLELKVHVIHAQGFSTEKDLSKIKNFHPGLVTINDAYLSNIRHKVEQYLNLFRGTVESGMPVQSGISQNLSLTFS